MKTHYQFNVTGILFVLATLLLSACGGSSDNSSTSPPTSTYSIGGTVTGLNSSGLVLQNNSSDDLDVAGVSFEFATELTDGSVYNVTILTQPMGQSCNVTDGNGTVSGTIVSNVTVTCLGWGMAEMISNGNAYLPQIGIDAVGNVMAVWVQTADFGENGIWANRYTAGSGWGTAEKIAPLDYDVDSPTVFNPQIAINAAGDVMVVWAADDPNPHSSLPRDYWANRYTAGSGWGTAEKIGSAGNSYHVDPQIAIDAAGNAIAVWSDYDDLYANRYTGGSWGIPVEIATAEFGRIKSQQIAIDDAGNAMVVWVQSDFHHGSDVIVLSNRYTANSGWGTVEPVGDYGSLVGVNPQIATDAAGDALVVWDQCDSQSDQCHIWANRYTANSGWGTAEKIVTHEHDIRYHSHSTNDPQIAIDAAGNAIAVWENTLVVDSYASADYIEQSDIWASYYTASSGWGTAVLIGGDDEEDHVTNPQIAIDDAGNAMAVWDEHAWDDEDNSPITRRSIWANRYTAGSGWGTAERSETYDDVDFRHYPVDYNPQIAVNADGNTMMAWHLHDGTMSNIWAKRFE